MVSPFDSNWTADSFVTAAQLNKVTLGTGTTAEREAVLDVNWENTRLFWDSEAENIFTRQGVEAGTGLVIWRALISAAGGFGNGSNGNIVEADYTDSSLTLPNAPAVTNYGSITIPENFTLNIGNPSTSSQAPNRYIMFINGTLTINGTLNLSGRGGFGGSAGSKGTGGAGGNNNTRAGTNGTNGTSGSAGYFKLAGPDNNTNGASVIGTDGGNGGTGGTAGGSGGSVHTGGDAGANQPRLGTDNDRLNLQVFDLFQTAFTGNLSQFGAGGDGGGGGAGGNSGSFSQINSGSGAASERYTGQSGSGGDGADGGIGGAGGGSILFVAFNIVFGTNGTINCNGMNGGAGLAGQAGETVTKVHGPDQLGVSQTDTANGGAAGSANGGNGGNGSNGPNILRFNANGNTFGSAVLSGGGAGGGGGGNGGNGDGGFIAIFSGTDISTDFATKVTVNAGTGGNAGTVGSKVFLQI